MMFKSTLQPNQTLVLKENKSFAWSWTRVKNHETCPRRYEGTDVTKEFKQDETLELNEGGRLHKGMARRIMQDVKLPAEFYYMEKYAEKLKEITHPLQIVNCELQLAINKEYRPVAFLGKGVWARCVVDYIKIVPKDKYSLAHIVDYKTGKLVDDDAQLTVNAMLVFCCFKDIIGIKSEFLWTKYSDTRSITYTRESIKADWNEVLSRVAPLEKAHIDNNFPPKPGRLCKEYCAVDTCEHWGQNR